MHGPMRTAPTQPTHPPLHRTPPHQSEVGQRPRKAHHRPPLPMRPTMPEPRTRHRRLSAMPPTHRPGTPHPPPPTKNKRSHTAPTITPHGAPGCPRRRRNIASKPIPRPILRPQKGERRKQKRGGGAERRCGAFYAPQRRGGWLDKAERSEHRCPTYPQLKEETY